LVCGELKGGNYQEDKKGRTVNERGVHLPEGGKKQASGK